jgi:hypothetical protein
MTVLPKTCKSSICAISTVLMLSATVIMYLPAPFLCRKQPYIPCGPITQGSWAPSNGGEGKNPYDASDGDRMTPGEAWDPEYDVSSPTYLFLRAKIRRLKSQGKPLLIKINSHPCAGKSHFIKKHAKNFEGLCQLFDFDSYIGADRTSSSLLKLNTSSNSALLGTAVYHAHRESSGGNEKVKYADVVYIHVVPPMKYLLFQIERRQATRNPNETWATTANITHARGEALSKVFSNGVQVEPLFQAFEEGLMFCLEAYETSEINAVSIE